MFVYRKQRQNIYSFALYTCAISMEIYIYISVDCFPTICDMNEKKWEKFCSFDIIFFIQRPAKCNLSVHFESLFSFNFVWCSLIVSPYWIEYKDLKME